MAKSASQPIAWLGKKISEMSLSELRSLRASFVGIGAPPKWIRHLEYRIQGFAEHPKNVADDRIDVIEGLMETCIQQQASLLEMLRKRETHETSNSSGLRTVEAQIKRLFSELATIKRQVLNEAIDGAKRAVSRRPRNKAKKD